MCSALISICSLLNILLPEGQPNKKIYNSFENLINSINLDNWIILYIFFELNLIKDLGYDVNLSQYNNDSNVEIKKIKIGIRDPKKTICIPVAKEESKPIITIYFNELLS